MIPLSPDENRDGDVMSLMISTTREKTGGELLGEA